MTPNLNSDSQLILIAIVLPEPVFSFVLEQQNYIAETWGCRHALRTPPHITLIPPVLLKVPESVELASIAARIAANQKPFTLKIKGFDAFTPRVIFLKPNFPHALSELYFHLRDAIIFKIPHLLNRYPDLPFVPHITLAYRDVAPEQFREIWKYYRNKKVQFNVEINQFCILDNTVDGWIITQVFDLAKRKV